MWIGGLCSIGVSIDVTETVDAVGRGRASERDCVCDEELRVK